MTQEMYEDCVMLLLEANIARLKNDNLYANECMRIFFNETMDYSWYERQQINMAFNSLKQTV